MSGVGVARGIDLDVGWLDEPTAFNRKVERAVQIALAGGASEGARMAQAEVSAREGDGAVSLQARRLMKASSEGRAQANEESASDGSDEDGSARRGECRRRIPRRRG